MMTVECGLAGYQTRPSRRNHQTATAATQSTGVALSIKDQFPGDAVPEGDTIHRSANQLRRVMVGVRIAAAACHNSRVERPLDVEHLVGQVCASVEARGKHLLMHLSSGSVVHSHMGMTGSWHVYQRGQRWRKPRERASLALQFEQFEAVCFTPKTLELLTPMQLRRHVHLNSLGPDLLAESFDQQDAQCRIRKLHAAPIGVALMDQRVASGIGNVYKSETLFIQRMNPFASVESFSIQQLIDCFHRAQQLMRRNLDGQRRKTRFAGGSRLWVYGRSGKPCLKCETLIQMQRQGEAGRSTYWCPQCQSVDAQ